MTSFLPSSSSKQGSVAPGVTAVAALLSLSVFGASAFAQQAAPAPKIGVIDLQRIAAESAEGKVANAKVQALTQKKASELNDKQRQLQAAQQKLEQGGAVLNDSTRGQLQKDIERLNVEIERFQQDANAEVTELGTQLQGDFQLKLRPVLDGVVKEMGLTILFSAGDAGAIYWDPSLDLTPEVIRRFDTAMASAKQPAAAAPAPKPLAPPAATPAPKPAPPPAAAPAPAPGATPPAPAPKP